jgi:hypothetical protein
VQRSAAEASAEQHMSGTAGRGEEGAGCEMVGTWSDRDDKWSREEGLTPRWLYTPGGLC